jgi:hypothetical protein
MADEIQKTGATPANNVAGNTAANNGIITVGSILNIPGAKQIQKTAGALTGGSSTMASNMFYTPELTPESWLLPKSRQEILKWCRIFFNLESYVQSILTMHARYPFSRFKLVCESDEIREFFEDAIDNDKWNLLDFLHRASLSYQVYGESLPFGNWNAQEKRWDKFVLLEPELVEVTQGLFDEQPKYELLVTDELRKLTNDAKFADQAAKLPDVVRTAIMSQKNIPLDPDCTSIIARLTSPSAVRGTPILQCCFKCVTAETKIALLDSTTPTVKELFESNRKNFGVYSIDKKNNIIGGVAEGVIKMPAPESILKITFDNGESIRCTHDHPLYLRDGKKVEAKELKVGDSMMPLYRGHDKRAKAYERVYNPATEKYVLTHCRVALGIGEGKTFIKKTEVIHHIDCNPKNNDPLNLKIMDRGEHAHWHQIHSASPERMRQFTEERWNGENSEQNKKKQSELMTKWWEDKHEWGSERTKKVWADKTPEQLDAIGKSLSEALKNNPKHKASCKAYWSSPEGRKQRFEINIARWAKVAPEKRIEMMEKRFGPNNHKIVSIIPDGVEEVYAVINVTPTANYAIAFSDGSGTISGNCLIFQDYIRLAQLKIAERHQLPFELWTLGNVEAKILPTQEDLEAFRDKINEAVQNPPYSMVMPPIVDYKALGVKDKLLNIYEDLGYVENQLFVAMGVNKNLMLGDGPSFSNVKTMSLNRLIMEYQTIRDMFERWIYNRVFRRIAVENNFYTYKGKIKKLIMPKIEWERSLNIEDEETERKTFTDLHTRGFISTKTLFNKFPTLNMEAEKAQLEAEKGTIFDKTDGKRIPKTFKPEEKKPELPGGIGGVPPLGGGPEMPMPEGGEIGAAPAPEGMAGILEPATGAGAELPPPGQSAPGTPGGGAI